LAYDQQKIFLKAQEQIEKHNLFFIEDIVAFLPCTKTTFYDFFPLDSNEMNTIKGLLDQNKIVTKSSIRSKLFKSDKAAELLALYKLICTESERDALSMQKVDHTSQGEKIGISTIQWVDGKDS